MSSQRDHYILKTVKLSNDILASFFIFDSKSSITCVDLKVKAGEKKMENYMKLWWNEAVKFLSISWGEARRGEMVVNYLFPLTERSPAPLRLSAPDSWQAERGVDVTRGLGTRNSFADGSVASSKPNLDLLARNISLGPDRVLGDPPSLWPLPRLYPSSPSLCSESSSTTWSSPPKSPKLTSLFSSPIPYLT